MQRSSSDFLLLPRPVDVVRRRHDGRVVLVALVAVRRQLALASERELNGQLRAGVDLHVHAILIRRRWG